jgi:hypothetical protein
MGNAGRRVGGVAAVVIAFLALVAAPASAATDADPSFTGGQEVAPFSGNDDAATASNGSTVLVVWRHSTGASTDIWGRFTSPDTTTIGQPFRISQREQAEEAPDVAWNGSSYLVVWEQVTGGGRDIRGRRVSTDGALLGVELAITNDVPGQEDPAVAGGANGQFLVAWRDLRKVSTLQGELYARRVGKNGGLMDGTGLRLSHDTATQSSNEATPDIAWNGSVYLVVFAQYGAHYAVWEVALRPDGTKAHDDEVNTAPTGRSPETPVVASDGTGFLVVFSLGISGSPGSYDLIGARITQSFAVGTSPIAQGAWDETAPAIAYNGSYAVAWVDRRKGKNDLRGTRLDRDATVLDPNGYLITEYYPDNVEPVLTNGAKAGSFTVAWTATPSSLDKGVLAFGMKFAPK